MVSWTSGSIDEKCVDPVGHGPQKVFQELPSRFSFSLLNQFGDSKFAGSFNGYKEIMLPVGRLPFGNVNAEDADRAALELLALGFVAAGIPYPRNSVPQQTAMKSRSAELRDARLQSMEAVIQREQSMAPESNDKDLFAELFPPETVAPLNRGRSLLAGLLGQSASPGRPFRDLIDAHLDAGLIEQIALRHQSGARLLIVTTNLDAERAWSGRSGRSPIRGIRAASS